MKTITGLILLCAAFACGSWFGHRHARREEWMSKYYATAYLRWGGMTNLGNIFGMQLALLKDDKELLRGAINDATIEALINANRAVEVVNSLPDIDVGIEVPELSIIKNVGINALKLGMTPLYAPETKVPDEAQWNPLQPPGFEKGRYFERLMKIAADNLAAPRPRPVDKPGTATD
jgi:hypothetical protein